MNHKHFIYLALAGCALCAGAAAAHEGRVFVDANGNGRYDRGEKTLKDVRVSDGLHVVRTGVDGTFSLPGHARERFLFITTPSGYWTDNAHYRRIVAGTLSYDFGVRPWKGRIRPDGSHRFVHLSDTEIFNTVNQEDWAENVRDYAANEGAAFILHNGDICYESGLKQHIHLMNGSNMDCPVFYCIGNHDLVKGKYGEELFERIYGPVYYSFDFGNVHYIVTPMAGGDYRPGYTKEDVYRWLANDLAEVPAGKPVILFNHDLVSYSKDFIFGISDKEQVNLSEHHLKAQFYGHWHNHFVRRQGEVLAISTATLDKGGIDHSTAAFRVVDVSGKGEVRTALRYTYLDKRLEIASVSNGHCFTDVEGRPVISVNLYHTVSPATRVTYACTVEGREVLPETALAQQSDWNWSATATRLPEDCRGKRLFLTVRARFGNGEEAVRRASFVYGSAVADSLATPAWIRNVHANLFFSAPAVDDGRVYIASVDEDLRGEAAIFALDARSGEQLWRYPVRNSIKNRIAVDDGTVFAQDAEGTLYAVAGKTGKLLWERKLAVNSLPVLSDGVAAAAGVVYAGSGKAFGAYDGKTGEPHWLNSGWAQGESTISTPLVTDEVVVSGANWRGFYGNDRKSGALRWSLDKEGISDRGATPALVDGLLYVASRQSFFIIDAATGQVVVRKPLPYNVQVGSTPLVTDQLICFGSQSHGLIALDRQTLEVVWTVPTLPALIATAPYARYPAATVESSPLLAPDGRIYFGASDGILYAVDPARGTVVWKHKCGAPILAAPTVADGRLYVADFGGSLYAFDL